MVVINIIIISSSSVLTPLRSHRRITVSRRSSSSSNISILDINSNNNSLHLRRLGLNKRTDRTCWAVTVAASVNLMHIIIINICGRTRRQCRRRCLPVEDEKEEKPNVGAWIGISNSNTKKSIERTRPRAKKWKKKKKRVETKRSRVDGAILVQGPQGMALGVGFGELFVLGSLSFVASMAACLWEMGVDGEIFTSRLPS